MAALTTCDVPWGGQSRRLAVPRDNRVVETAMTDLSPLPDVLASLVDAIEHPIGCQPLSCVPTPRRLRRTG
jgi:hypothetical protein